MPRFLAAALVLVSCVLGAFAGEARAAEVRRTSLQYAAVQGYRHSDSGSHVLLERGTLRLRLYPDTDRVLIGGREYQVKDRFDRLAGHVMVSARVQRFLTRQAHAFQVDERSRLDSAHRHVAPLPKLEPLPPRPVRVKRTPKPIRWSKAKPAPRPQAGVAGDPAWTPRGVDERSWKWIVVHHSDDLSGDLAKYDRYHRIDKGWENGCGYHFVIGNGSKSGDGEIEVGPRWEAQLQGAHAKVPGNRFNERGIGICLVGNFDENGSRPSAAQMDALVRLIRWLKARYRITDANLHGHCECCTTRCPGQFFPWREVRRRTR